MELSCIKYKWVNSLVYSPLKHIKMNQQERRKRIAELSSMIVDLKRNKTIDSKKTIQKLQQEMDNLGHE